MNNSELNDLLRRAHVPERSEGEWKEAAGDTMRALRKVDGLAAQARPPVRRFALWATGIATACILIGFLIGHWHSRQTVRHNEIAEARKLFNELSAMFPNQLEAIVLDGSSPQLVLAEKPSANRGAPLFVRICGAKACQRVITFSGERVPLNGENCEVLVDARGHVIIAGERFVWSSRDGTKGNAGYRIEAALLSGVL